MQMIMSPSRFLQCILLRKIAAILRRTQREDELQVISYKTLSVDVKGHHVYICKAEKGEQIEVN